jgi:hypothetical protein
VRGLDCLVEEFNAEGFMLLDVLDGEVEEAS